MRLECPHCRRPVTFEGEPPRFCSYCGRPLATEAAAEELSRASTLVRPGPTEQTGTHDLAQTLGSAPTILPGGGLEPQTVGGYRLGKRLGAGGVGTVYEAVHEASGRRVALKLLSRDVHANRDALARFRQEGRLASQLSHPRCVFVYGADEHQGRPYIVMELMPGHTLTDLVRSRGPLPVDEAVAKIVDVIDGLMEAHRLGLVHRDVKPSNCFLQADGRVKIGDFGLSKSLTRPAEGDSDGGHNESLTRTGAFLGTPLYAAPEQVRGEKADQAVDVYAVCATLYYLLTGKAPFEGGAGDAMSIMARIVADDPRPLRALCPAAPVELEQVVMKGLARDKRERWRGLEALRLALAPFQARRAGYAGLGLRIGAMIVDLVLLVTVDSLMQFVGLLLYRSYTGVSEVEAAREMLTYEGQLILNLLHPISMALLYFTLFEGILGQTPGKWLLGLNVVRAEGLGKPGLYRALARSACYLLAINGVHIADFTFMPPPAIDRSLDRQANEKEWKEQMDRLTEHSFSHAPAPTLSLVAGILLISSSMRRRNGYRGLHEFASGTRVIVTPPRWLRPTLERTLHCADLSAQRRANLPERFGPFTVQGACDLSGGGELLVARESGLERPVWIWRHGAGREAASLARHEVSRQTRPRWLAAGTEDGRAWDAFLAAPGMLLVDSIAAQGPMTWKETRAILEQLVDETLEAQRDGTLPEALSVGQVWLSGQGQAQLLDFALKGKGEQILVGDAPARLCRFFRDLATLCLEGQVRADNDPGYVRTALPLHAAELLLPLVLPGAGPFKVEDLKAKLVETEHLPTETTRGRRIVHFGLHLAAVFLLFLILTAVCNVLLMQDLPPGDAAPPGAPNGPRGGAPGGAPRPSPAQSHQPSGPAATQATNPPEHEKNTPAHSRGRIDPARAGAWVAGAFQVAYPLAARALNWDAGEADRFAAPVMAVPSSAPEAAAPTAPARAAAAQAPSPAATATGGQAAHPHDGGGLNVRMNGRSYRTVWLTVLAPITLGGAWLLLVSYLSRGGMLLAVFGLALCRSRGGRLGRWRCVLRSLLAGLPPIMLFTLAASFSDANSVAQASVRLACTIGLVAYLVLLTAAVAWKPAGTWYDYLVGARIVPK